MVHGAWCMVHGAWCRWRTVALAVVFIRIRNTKPWNHLHMCIVVLWTKIVVEFMSLYSGFSDKETGNRMRCESL